MMGWLNAQILYRLVSLAVGFLAAYGAYRYRSWGLASLAFSHLFRFVTSAVIQYYWSTAVLRPASIGPAPIMNWVNTLSLASNVAVAFLAIVTVVMLLRDFARWKRRADEAEAQVDRLARERMERDREASLPLAASTGEP